MYLTHRIETKKKALVETSQHMSRGLGQSVESRKYMSKWAQPLKLLVFRL